MNKTSSFERVMNGPARFLVSIVAVSAMFALGRLIASRFNRDEDGGEEITLQTPPSETILIQSEPESVFALARNLEYFNKFLFGVDEIQMTSPTTASLTVAENGHEYGIDLQVIAEQPAEFFGLRVEHDGQLYGTCVIRFEAAPGNNTGTIVTAVTKYKVILPATAMNVIKPVVAREIDVYLHHLKELCEPKITASV